MNRFLRPLLFVTLIYFSCLSQICAQSANEISSPLQEAEQFFNSTTKHQSLLFNGPSFPDYAFNVRGSANFQDLSTFSKGAVVYQGFRFDDVPLIYDLYQDKVVTLFEAFSKYSLLSNRVTEFYLNKHHFKYITVIDTVQNIIKSGFYDFIFEGQSKILAKRKKTMQSSTDNTTMWYYFLPRTSYYLERNNNYYAINGKKSFLNFFKDKKPELERRLKQSKIKFKKEPEQAMILLASHYESLIN